MRLSGIGKRYGNGPWVLSDVDLELSGGDVVAVVGGNGAGKSTLLRMMVGLSRPTVGAVLDRPASVGYVPDRFPPHDRMSAQSYLAYMGRIRGMSAAAARARAIELLGRLSLVGGAETPLRQLSKGNAQKVALAQALLLRPDLLVLDEPWSGLDASAHSALAEILGEVRAGGGCVVFTDQREAVATIHATRIQRISAGRLTEEPVRDLVETAKVELLALEDGAELGELPGVLGAWERTEGVTVVAVAGDHCDELLRAALSGGWSVLSVRRAVLPTVEAAL